MQIIFILKSRFWTSGLIIKGNYLNGSGYGHHQQKMQILLSRGGILHTWQHRMKLCRSCCPCNLQEQSLSCLSETGKGLITEMRLPTHYGTYGNFLPGSWSCQKVDGKLKRMEWIIKLKQVPQGKIVIKVSSLIWKTIWCLELLERLATQLHLQFKGISSDK